MTVTWTKTGDSLETEVGTTENLGDVGYVYKDGSRWTSVYIFDNGQEMDTSCGTKGKAKTSVIENLEEEILQGGKAA